MPTDLLMFLLPILVVSVTSQGGGIVHCVIIRGERYPALAMLILLPLTTAYIRGGAGVAAHPELAPLFGRLPEAKPGDKSLSVTQNHTFSTLPILNSPSV